MGRYSGKISRDKPQKYQHKKSGQYIIYTDTDQTEKNYFTGLKNNLPLKSQEQIDIVVKRADTPELLKACREESLHAPNYAQIAIVFDRDEVHNFDEIIRAARREKFKVGWSNPCFEIWMHAYFGSMPTFGNSKECTSAFSRLLKSRTGKEYEKNDKEIYSKLIQYGNETKAIQTAKTRMINFGKEKPSKMDSCTTVWEIVEEIRKNIENHS